MKIDIPYLDAWVDCWLFQIHTAIWRTAWDDDTRDYVILEFRMRNKWGFRFRLYDTTFRIMERKSPKMKDATRGKIDRVTMLSDR